MHVGIQCMEYAGYVHRNEYQQRWRVALEFSVKPGLRYPNWRLSHGLTLLG